MCADLFVYREGKENEYSKNSERGGAAATLPELLYGDCLEIIKSLPDKSVDMVLTDPPYKIETSGGGIYKQEGKKYIKDIEQISNGFSEEILNQCCRVMKKINIYIFCSQKQIIPLLDFFVKKKKCNWNIISWHKSNPVPACGNKYLTDTEYIMYFREKGVRVYGSYETKRTWYLTPLNTKEKKKYGHPTIKPVDILKNLILNSSVKQDIILDPFMGSGSTGVACINTGREFIGIELSGYYYKVAQERINKAIADKQ